MKKNFFFFLICSTAIIFLFASHVTCTTSSPPRSEEEVRRRFPAAEDQSTSAGVQPQAHSPFDPFAYLADGQPSAVAAATAEASRRAISNFLLADAEETHSRNQLDETIASYHSNPIEEEEDEQETPAIRNQKRNRYTQTWARNSKQRLRTKLEVIRSEPYGRDRLTETLTRAGKPLTVRWTANDVRNLALLEAHGITGTGKIKNLVSLAQMANPRFTAQANPEEVFRAWSDKGVPDDNMKEMLQGVSVEQQIQLADEVFQERLAIAAPYGRPNPFGLDATLVARLGKAGLRHLEDLHHHVSVIATRRMRQDVLRRLDGAVPGGEADTDTAAAPSSTTKSSEDEDDLEKVNQRIGNDEKDSRRKKRSGRELSYLRKRVTQKLKVQAKPASQAGRPRMWTTSDAADLRTLLNAGATKVLKYVEEAQRANPNFRVEGVEPKLERMKRKRAKIEAFFEKLNASHRVSSDGTLAERPPRAEEEGDRGKGIAEHDVDSSSGSSIPDSFSSLDSLSWGGESVSPPRMPYHPRQMRISRAFISSRHPAPTVHGSGQQHVPPEQLTTRPVLPPFRQVHPPLPSLHNTAHHQPSPPYSRRHRALLASSMLESTGPRPPAFSHQVAPLHPPLLPPIRPFTSFRVDPTEKTSAEVVQWSPASLATAASPSQGHRQRGRQQHPSHSPPLPPASIIAPHSPIPSASIIPLNDDSVPPSSSSSSSSTWPDNFTPEWLQYLLNLKSP